jgi:hypothetical protein
VKLPKTPAEVGLWLKEECRKSDRMEKILTPVFLILAVLVVLILWSLPVLDMMGKLPKP